MIAPCLSPTPFPPGAFLSFFHRALCSGDSRLHVMTFPHFFFSAPSPIM
jgi:hypothetical protein